MALVSLLAGLGCEPESIAPLPSPLEPDEDRILASSLPLTADTERSVAIVGFDGAVEGLGEVLLTNQRTGREVDSEASEGGSFVGRVLALPGDVFSVTYLVDGRASAPIEVTVRTFVPPNDKTSGDPGEGPEPSQDDENRPPPVSGNAGARDGSGGGTDGDGDGYQAGDPTYDPQDGAESLTMVSALEDGELHVVAPEGFTVANALLVFANETSGGVHQAQADETGAFDIRFPASHGDVILMFTQNPNKPDITGEVVTIIAN